jgi:hypothetical protein
MLRIVKMTFKEREITTFQLHFDKIADQIRRFKGCHGLALVQDKKDKRIFFTLSDWEGEKALNAYRHSDLFKQTWSKVKPLFAQRAEAWSVDKYWENGLLK